MCSLSASHCAVQNRVLQDEVQGGDSLIAVSEPRSPFSGGLVDRSLTCTTVKSSKLFLV